MATDSTLSSGWRPHLLCAGILALLCLLLYGNSLDAPFYLDDFESIGNNRVISEGSATQVVRAHPQRALTYLSFWMDYQLRGPDPRDFRLSNVILHALNAWLVYFLTWQILTARGGPRAGGADKKSAAKASQKKKAGKKTKPRRSPLDNWTPLLAPLFAGLLFACHPLHTQAVTYVVQRSASLVCLFYLSTLILYLTARLSTDRRRVIIATLCATATFIAAMFSKQNAATLPIALLLCEWLVVGGRLQLTRQGTLIACALATLAFALLLFVALGPVGETLDRLTRDAQMITRLDYLLAQQSVVLMYLAKFLLPLNLRLEYDLQVDAFSALASAAAAAIHIALIGAAIALRPHYAAFTFGILFYYAAHLVESGLIPIKDLAFEHRAYLPDVGLVIAMAALVAPVLTSGRHQRRFIGGACTALLLLSVLTLLRNEQWRDPVAFYEREYRFSPDHPRVVANLANRLIDAGDRARALEVLGESYKANDGEVPAQLAAGYLYLLMETRSKTETYQFGDEVLARLDDRRARLPVLVNLGFFAMRQGDFALAERFLREAVQLPGSPLDAQWSLAIALQRQGRLSAARAEVLRLLERQPRHEGGRQLLRELEAAGSAR